jgi:hypothetical protein
VSDELSQAFVADFEAGMDRFWNEHNIQTSEFLRDMARFFAPFEPLPGNLYVELIKLLGGTRKKVIFATTNYDLLIEHAVAQAGLLVTYGGLPAEPRNVPIIKIHGSCNFLPDMQPLQISGIGFNLIGSAAGGILEAGVRVASSAKEVIEFCRREDSVAPALAMYSPSKRVLFCRSFIQGQQQALNTAIKNASRIYVVGLRVHAVDEHIWGPLAESEGNLYYVGREPEEFISWHTSVKRRQAYALCQSFAEALPYIAAHHRCKRVLADA